jgi:hypothetical protein
VGLVRRVGHFGEVVRCASGKGYGMDLAVITWQLTGDAMDGSL